MHLLSKKKSIWWQGGKWKVGGRDDTNMLGDVFFSMHRSRQLIVIFGTSLLTESLPKSKAQLRHNPYPLPLPQEPWRKTYFKLINHSLLPLPKKDWCPSPPTRRLQLIQSASLASISHCCLLQSSLATSPEGPHHQVHSRWCFLASRARAQREHAHTITNWFMAGSDFQPAFCACSLLWRVERLKSELGGRHTTHPVFWNQVQAPDEDVPRILWTILDVLSHFILHCINFCMAPRPLRDSRRKWEERMKIDDFI